MPVRRSWRCLSELHTQGSTIVMVTHDEKIAAYAGRIIHFVDGKIETDHQNGKFTRRPATVGEGNYAPE